MLGETTFLIVPFDWNADGKLQPGAPARLDTEDAAEFAAGQIAHFHGGIAIIEEPVGAFDEPRLIATFGQIPDETLEIFGAATKSRKRLRVVDQLRDLVSRAADGISDVKLCDSVSVTLSQKRRALRALSKHYDWRPA